jgi:MFS family permease
MISKRQIIALFLCIIIALTIGNAIMALLPVYATQAGMDSSSTGNYMAFAFFALSAGSILAGWLSRRFQLHKPFLVAIGLINIPLYWLMQSITDFGMLMLAISFVWFLGGISFAMTNILAALSASETERGKVFGIVALAMGIGTLIGGAIAGPIADRWGFSALLAVSAVLQIFYVGMALLLEDKKSHTTQAENQAESSLEAPLGSTFYLLLGANAVASIAMFMSNLGRPLGMNALQFDATAISSVIAVGSAITLPIPALIGWLSDRIGRRGLIAACYLMGALGLTMLMVSTSLWHFWLSSVLIAFISASNGLTSALVADIIPRRSLGLGLSLINTGGFLAGIVGFAGTGYVIQGVGLPITFMLGAILPLIAIILLIPIRHVLKPAPI